MILHSRDRKLVAAILRYQRGRDGRGAVAWLRRQHGKLGHIVWSILSANHIERDATIAADLKMPHPHGIVVHQRSAIGERCLIMQQVTLGQIGSDGAPLLESDVYFGAGAKILGPVKVGRGARIGANAVVLEDVPPGATAVGVPARIICASTSKT